MIVVILRHGEAEGQSPTGRDADRRLTERGAGQAAHIGAWLRERIVGEWAEDADRGVRLRVSPAVRTAMTAEKVAARLGDAGGFGGVEVEHRLFTDAAASALLGVIREAVSAGVGVLVLVGHNPTVSRSVELLAGEGQPGMRTGEAAAFRLDGFGGDDDPLGRGILLNRERLS